VFIGDEMYLDPDCMSKIVFIDCESTGLDIPSRPIEVGLAWCDGKSEAYLIKNCPYWKGVEWNPESSKIHRITPEQVEREGQPPYWVATWLNQQLEGMLVFSDCPKIEAYWLNSLFRASNVKPHFGLRDSEVVFYAALGGDTQGRRQYAKIKRSVYMEFPHMHRAAPDALAQAMFVKEAVKWRSIYDLNKI
jgi:Exonuclease